MVLDRHRGLLDFVVVPLARSLRNVNPNTITWTGLLVAALASVFILLSSPEDEPSNYYLVVVSLLIFLHGILDMVDGKMARLHQKATPLGDFLDHAIDRFSDVLLLTALAFSPWGGGDLRVGFFAAVMTLLSSYIGTQAQAVGVGRIYAGFLGRADRLLLLILAPLADHFMTVLGGRADLLPSHPWIDRLPDAPYFLTLVLYYIAVGGLITTLERFWRLARHLRREARRAARGRR